MGLEGLGEELHKEGMSHVGWVLEAFIASSNEGQKDAIDRAIVSYILKGIEKLKHATS